MVIVTGAAGFIGSCFLTYLLELGRKNIVAVDDFSREDRELNYINKSGILKIDRGELFKFISSHEKEIDFIIHLGARTDTVDQNRAIFEELNLNYSKKIWTSCTNLGIPLIYASSAATYGDGRHGFDDEMENISILHPMNEYGISKQEVDIWASNNKVAPPYWIGLKFFNVYGPNEYHKGRMASVIFHAFHQIKSTGKMKLFRSHRSDYKDGEQRRDFIYVMDVCETIMKLMNHQIDSGIYNLGTGKARTFNDLVMAVFKSLELEPNIEYIDIPEDIRSNYQYYTEAKMAKLSNQGIPLDYYSLKEGVKDYVQNYLDQKKYF